MLELEDKIESLVEVSSDAMTSWICWIAPQSRMGKMTLAKASDGRLSQELAVVEKSTENVLVAR